MKIGTFVYIDAAHLLPGEDYGKCQSLHGHRWKVEVEVSGPIDKMGWVMNFFDLKSIMRVCITDKLDHSYLNQTLKIPTAENLVMWIKAALTQKLIQDNLGIELERVKVFETENNWAVYERGESD